MGDLEIGVREGVLNTNLGDIAGRKGIPSLVDFLQRFSVMESVLLERF